MKADQNNQTLYDLSMIQTMSGGDEAFMAKMIRLFIDTVPQNVKELLAATNTQNWEQVSKLAHKLKSTVDSMGIKCIRDDIRQVESDAKENKNLHSIPSTVQKIDSVIHDCVEQLRTTI
jgi:HPt (histidine-containing phosphotransfer) domain-containing protein